MEKKYEEDELDKLIEEQFISEAKIMEEALFSDDDTEDYDASEEEIKASYQELISRLKADGVYREDKDAAENCSESTDNIPGGNKAYADAVPNSSRTAVNKVVPMPKKRSVFNSHRFIKAAGFVLVSAACVFAASMTSEANRNYVVRNVRYLVGDRTRVVSDNDDQNEIANVDEYEAIEDIEEQLGVDVPEFFYRPQGFEFYKYEVVPVSQFARVDYLYNDIIIEFGMDKEDANTVSSFYNLHGEEIDIIDVKGANIQISISKIQDEQDEFPSYLAQWENENIIYYITGKIDLDELIKILEEMRFQS